MPGSGRGVLTLDAECCHTLVDGVESILYYSIVSRARSSAVSRKVWDLWE